MGSAVQDLDAWLEPFLAVLGHKGSVSARAKPDGAGCRTSSGYAASRIASTVVARQR